TCNPKDILMAQKAMQKRYYFADVHVHGFYPEHIFKYWERKAIKVDFTEQDKKDLLEGTVDYIGFSYYMS
ncbi:family 1 glycosylhydrolase, partial [Streptococcus mutans]